MCTRRSNKLKRSGEIGAKPRGPNEAACCGAPLFIQDDVAAEWMDVTVASLDDPGAFPPQAAIWTEDKLPWVMLDPSRPAFRRNRNESGSPDLQGTAD